MAGRFANPVPQFLSDNITALAGGKLYFYVTGTTTPLDTYSDSGLTTPNSNPVILDSAGRVPNIYASYESVFRVVLKTSADVTIWTKDDVQFSDVQELVTLAAQLQAQIDAIETVITNSNPIKNPTTEAISPDDSVTLTTSFLPHVCVAIDGRVSGTISAGTMQAGTLSGLGSVSRQAKMAGVTGDSSSIIEWRFRVGSAEARRFANETCSISAVMRQESGVTATATIALSKANSADDFSAVTLVGSTTAAVTSSTNTGIEYAGLAMGDVSNGIELVIKVQPGASFTTKDFYLTDIKIEVGAAATDFTAPSFTEVRSEAYSASFPVYRDSGTTNAIVIATGEATGLYDGLTVSIYRTASNSGALTLQVDGNSAKSVVRPEGKACRSGDTVSGRVYQFRYDAANDRFSIVNPEVRQYLLTARGYVNTTTAESPVLYGDGITSVTYNSTGNYTITLRDTYVSSGGVVRMYPCVQTYQTAAGLRVVKITAMTSTTFTFQIEASNDVANNTSPGFYVLVSGELNA